MTTTGCSHHPHPKALAFAVMNKQQNKEHLFVKTMVLIVAIGGDISLFILCFSAIQYPNPSLLLGKS
jgi:hypothetical protein